MCLAVWWFSLALCVTQLDSYTCCSGGSQLSGLSASAWSNGGPPLEDGWRQVSGRTSPVERLEFMPAFLVRHER